MNIHKTSTVILWRMRRGICLMANDTFGEASTHKIILVTYVQNKHTRDAINYLCYI